MRRTATELNILNWKQMIFQKTSADCKNENPREKSHLSDAHTHTLASIQTLDCLHRSRTRFDVEVNTRQNENAKHQKISTHVASLANSLPPCQPLSISLSCSLYLSRVACAPHKRVHICQSLVMCVSDLRFSCVQCKLLHDDC